MGLPAPFFAGRTPPDEDIYSPAVTDFYNEHIARCFEGFSYRGTRITGDHYFYLNINPIELSEMDGHRKPTGRFVMDYPLWSQADDYVFKQIEEAHEAVRKYIVMLLTSRAWGKTYLVNSIPVKLYLFQDNTHNLISGSSDAHATKSFNKVRLCLDEIHKRHPALTLNRLKDTDGYIESGYEYYDDKGKHTAGRRSKLEMTVYDREAGKTKNGRYDSQVMEEIGDWSRPATLEECVSASKGSWKVGLVDRCRVFMIGTGGTVFIRNVQSMFYNPDAWGIYKVKDWSERGTAIMIPAYKKLGGTWEKTGVSDEVLAKKELDAERKLTESDPKAYAKLIQEFPYNPDEIFSLGTTTTFNKEKLSAQLIRLLHNPDYQKVKNGRLQWKLYNGKKSSVTIDYDSGGPVQIVEEPVRDKDGNVPANMYIAGIDSIDQGTAESVEKKGSSFSIRVKKRQSTIGQTGNLYVCRYHARPRTAEEAWEIALMIVTLYNCRVNLEYSKIAIIGHFKINKMYHRLMQRPALQRSDMNSSGYTHLIGTVMNEKARNYGLIRLQKLVDDYVDQMFFKEDVEEFLVYSVARQKFFDGVVSYMMTEIGDDDLDQQGIISEKAPVPQQLIGYYTDPVTGYRKRGIIPAKQPLIDRMGQRPRVPQYYDENADQVTYYE